MSKNTRKPVIPEHVFISFSQDDKEIAGAIVHTLYSKGIPAWIDYAEVVPGTPDWEAAIRDAIEKSFAVVVLASPQSRASKYVRGELNVAESKGCQIFPLWIDGADWSDCIPLGMTYAQYIDARGKRHEQGIAELCEVLKQHIRNATPKHYYVSPLRRRVGRKRDGSLTQVSPPPGFVSVEITEGDVGWEEGGSAAFLRSSDYSCMQAFLDELYIGYVNDRFKPFTYGSSWILEESSHYSGLLLVPWSWLAGPHASSQLESEWLHRTPLNDCGVRPGTSWRLRTPTGVKPTGVAVHDERILQAIRNSPKAEYFLRHNGILTDQPIAQVSADYKFRFVLSQRSFFDEEPGPGTAIVQSQKALPEELIKRWLERW